MGRGPKLGAEFGECHVVTKIMALTAGLSSPRHRLSWCLHYSSALRRRYIFFCVGRQGARVRSLFTECSQALDAATLLAISTDIAYYHRECRGYAHKQVLISLNLRTKSCYKLCGNPICAHILVGICSSLFLGGAESERK
jgi:hypothetical protein